MSHTSDAEVNDVRRTVNCSETHNLKRDTQPVHRPVPGGRLVELNQLSDDAFDAQIEADNACETASR